MLYADVITLITDTTTQDADGYLVSSETATEVYADVQSATRMEFYEAMRSGISISIVFRISAHDYEDQRLVDYGGVRYKVERTYQTGPDHIELNCSEVKRP